MPNEADGFAPDPDAGLFLGEDWGDAECSWCGGDAYVECDDPIQCCARHVSGMCPCGACGGTGLRKHQVIF